MSEEAARISGVWPRHGRRRRRHLEGETDASGLHGVDVSVGLARMLLPGVLMGGPDTTGWCCGMSEEAARVSGAWPPSRTAPPAAPRGGKLPRRFYMEWM